MNLCNEEDMAPNNVVAINEDAAKHLEILRHERAAEAELHTRCYGVHKQVVVDPITRTIECQHCKRVIDPFEYLDAWAKEGDRRMTGLKGLDIKLRLRNAEVSDLERKIKNLRSTLKRLGGASMDEHRAFQSAEWNPHSEETRKFLADKGTF